jgi:predicted DNA-binding transcriptional regulator AlpA
MENARLININELSQIIGINPKTIYNQLSCGTFPIPTRKVGRLLRWNIKDVYKFIKALPAINAAR